MRVYRTVDCFNGITPPIKRKVKKTMRRPNYFTSNLVTANVDYCYGNEEYRKPELVVQGVSEMDFL